MAFCFLLTLNDVLLLHSKLSVRMNTNEYLPINATQLKIRCQIPYHTTHSFLHLRRACLLSAQYFKG